ISMKPLHTPFQAAPIKPFALAALFPSSLLAALLIGFVSSAAPALHAAPPSDAEVKTRAEALEVAGAFSNDGFKIRDGHWSAPLDKEKPALLQVNLYAGNQYWFIAAATDEAQKIAVTL